MRVLIFAHVPPPHHGQSYMVLQALENLGRPGRNDGLTLFHVNAQLSDDLFDIGSWRIGKFFRLLGYIGQAWWLRATNRIDAFYYVPAPAKRTALYRDWLVLLFTRPLFKKRIFHWHSIGLGEWVKESPARGGLRSLEAAITRRLYSGHDLSCVLNKWGQNDVEIFSPQHTAIVPNGIPDPCPDFDSAILPERQRRLHERGKGAGPVIFRLLYLAHATRTKGLFDAVEAVALANARLAAGGNAMRIHLTVAGAFVLKDEEDAFRERIARADLNIDGPAVKYAGFLEKPAKDQLLRESDALCFPSYFQNEGQPVSVIEGFAYGLPVVLGRWRALPEMIPAELAYLADPHDVTALAEAILRLAEEERFESYRTYFLEHYTIAAHCAALKSALLSIAS